MYINFRISLLLYLLIMLIGQIHGQQVEHSRPMMVVKKHYPAYEILINGKKLPPALLKDITRIEIHESMNSTGGFNIRLNNWDIEKRVLKYSKRNQFNQGDKVEISLLKDKIKHSFILIKGNVTAINKYFRKTDSSILVIEGLSRKPNFKYSAKSEKVVYKIDSSNRDMFKLKTNKARDKIEVSLSNQKDINGLSDIIKSGCLIELNEVGTTFNGVYFISQVTHTITSSGYTVSFTAKRNVDDN